MRLDTLDQAALNIEKGIVCASLHETSHRYPEGLRLATHVITRYGRRKQMAKSPMEILRDLNLSLNNQNLEQAKGMLDEQRRANKPAPDRSKVALRTACLNVIRVLDSHGGHA
jgi:hypothetical protein